MPVPSLLRKRFHRSSSLHILCAKTALRRGCVFALEGRSRCPPDCHTRWLTWPGPWLRCVWSQLKKQKSVLLRACDQMLCESIGIFLGENYFFSVRSVAFLRKMWRETEIKITVALIWFIFSMGRTIEDWAGFDRLSWVFDHSSRGSRHLKEWEQRGRNNFWQRKVWTHCEFQRYNGDLSA